MAQVCIMYMLLKAGANGDFVIVINSQKIYHKALSESPTTIRILNALIDDKFPYPNAIYQSRHNLKF